MHDRSELRESVGTACEGHEMNLVLHVLAEIIVGMLVKNAPSGDDAACALHDTTERMREMLRDAVARRRVRH